MMRLEYLVWARVSHKKLWAPLRDRARLICEGPTRANWGDHSLYRGEFAEDGDDR